MRTRRRCVQCAPFLFAYGLFPVILMAGTNHIMNPICVWFIRPEYKGSQGMTTEQRGRNSTILVPGVSAGRDRDLADGDRHHQ